MYETFPYQTGISDLTCKLGGSLHLPNELGTRFLVAPGLTVTKPPTLSPNSGRGDDIFDTSRTPVVCCALCSPGLVWSAAAHQPVGTSSGLGTNARGQPTQGRPSIDPTSR